MPTDAELLASPDPEDFGRFYDRHVRTLLGWLVRRTGRPDLAADLTAETFAAALEQRRRFDARRGSARAWLYGIAAHKLADARRRGRAEDSARRRLGQERIEPDTEDLRQIAALGDAWVVELVETLPPGECDAVRGRVLEGLGYAELARRLRTSEAAARQRVSRGLRALRAALEGET
jgi:RNA polymerase sigma factor (sigma-70 family)